MNGQMLNRIGLFLGGLILFSLLFLSDIHLGKELPAFQIIDFLLPFVVIYLFMRRTELKWQNYYVILLLFCVYIPISMFINGRLNKVIDYFEIYKMLKFLLIILLFTFIDFKQFSTRWLKPLFYGLVILNFVHFFNLFDFNTFLHKYYIGGIQLEYFGLNSLKEPSVKRMVGTMGNPNINAVVFSIFAVIFIPFNFSKKQLSIFLLAILMVFLCQSRTALIAWALILIGIAILRLANWKWKEWMLILSGFVLMYFISWALATDFFKYSLYSNYILDGSILQTGSAMGRWEAWTLLGNMIVEKPIFGHGVNKEFFYVNHIYSENEYILMAWRYGLIGLLLYLGIFLYPAFNLIKRHQTHLSKVALLFLVLLLTTALTNNPFSDRTVVIFFAMILGFSFSTESFTSSNTGLPKNEN